MASIYWLRVDDRLIHGQVTAAWRRVLRYSALWVVDDLLASDAYLSEVMVLAAPAGVTVRVHTVEGCAAALGAAPDRLLLLLKRPRTALALLDAGVSMVDLMVGNVAPVPGSRRVVNSISLGAEGIAALDALSARGVCVVLQPTPDDAAVAWEAVRRRLD